MKARKRILATLCMAAMMLSMFTQGLMPMTAYAGSTAITFTKAGGGSESIYAEVTGVTASDILGVSWTGTSSGALTTTDIQYLVRDKGDYVRIDIPGIKPGTYKLSVATEDRVAASQDLSVKAYDRSGFAHFNYTGGVGAYKDDGTLKENAIVLYVTDENKNSVQLSYGGKTVTGIGNILNSVGQESSGGLTSNGGAANTNQGIIKDLALAGKPLVVRFLGTVTDSGLRTRGAFDASKPCLINGLTAYDSVDQGGTAGDNGHMARIQSGKDITLEGVGSDAVIDGWGFHFIAQSSNPELGKSFEVRNLTFINTAEDAVGMEGQQAKKDASSDLTASVERCWVHNNEFYCPEISSPAESDKGEGDGSVDFKRGQYFTCSYNYFEGCHKTNLVGSADYSLQFNLTYHHNYWFMCSARGPLTRRANVHMYNNVFEMQTDYAMNTRADAYIFSEYNLFYACKSPHAVEAGAIKSFNDSLASPLYKKGSPATVVSDRSEIVPNNCAFSARNIDYSKFDTDSTLSYIPGGNYDLQTDLTELRKVIAARTGTMGDPVKDPDDIVPGDYSLITRSGTNVEQIALPYEKTYSATEGKFSKKCYAFEVTAPAEVTVSYGTNPGVLVNDAGEMLLEGSGSVANLPAGKYMIQAAVVQPGSYANGDRFVTWKEFNLESLSVKATDPEKHYHTLVLAPDECVSESCTAAGKNVYKCSDPNCDDPSYRKVDILPALGHAWGNWTVTKEATQTEAGSKTRKCGRCDATETEEIPAGSGGETGNVYTITLDYNYDDAPDDIVMEEIPENRVYNSVDGLIPDGFGRTGYTLNGLYSDPDCGEPVSFPYTVTSSATLYAGWTEDDAPVSHYYLIFDANGGSDVPTAALPSSGSYEITQTSTRKGYRFEGWFDSPAGGEKVTALSISSVTDNVTVYAHWEKDENVDESFVAASFLNDINALSDYEKYGHILDYKDEQGQTVKGSAYKAGTNGNDDNPLIYGPFTFTDWKIPSKQKDTIAALYGGTTSGTLKVEAPAASVLTIKGRTTDGDNANYTLTGPDGRAYLPEESGKTNKFSGKTIETRTYKLGMAGVYTLAYDGEKQTAEGGNVGEVRFAEVNLKGVSDESADPWHIVKFVQKSEAESGTAREISLIKKAHGDFLDEDDFPSPSLDAGDVFKGWYPENGTPEGALKPEEIAGERVMNDMIYHAAIEKAESGVTYTVGYSISGNVLYSETVKAGETLSDIPVVSVPAGASFKGWSETENGTLINTDTWVPAEDDTLYAVIEKVSTEPRAWVYDVTAHGTTYSNATDVYTLTDTSSTKTGTDSMFVVSGSLKSDDSLTSGTVTVNPGLTCGPYPSSKGKYLKMESKTSITFTAPNDGCTLYVFTDTDTHKENDKTVYSSVQLDGKKTSAPMGDKVITITDIKKGDHAITKGDSINVGAFVLVDKPESTKYVLSVLDPYFAGVENSLIPGEYLKGTVVSFSAKPREGYKDLQVTEIIGSDETPLEPDENGIYSVTMDSDITIGLKADADTSEKYSVDVLYGGASSDLTPGFYSSGTLIDFNARLNPGYENLGVEVEEIKREGELIHIINRTDESLINNPDGSYTLKITDFNARVAIYGLPIDPTGLAITNGTEEIAKYPGSPEGNLEVEAGASLTLSTNVLPAEAVCDVVWTSGDESVAKVSRGRIIPIAAGETVITAKADGYEEVGVSITLKVKEPQPESASIKLNGSVVSEDQPLDLNRGEIVTLSPSVAPAGVNYTASWESETPSVATVDNGTITAVGPGESVITLTVKGAGADATTLTAKAKVVVTDIVPTGLSLKDPDGKNLTGDSIVPLKTGNKFLVTAEIKPADATVGTVTFSSGSPLTAKVDPSTGEVTALLPGTATITAALTWTSGSDQGRIESSFKVVVSLLPDPEVEPESFTIMDPAGNELTAETVVPMKVGDKLNVSSKIQPEGAIGAVTYASSAPGTASVKLLTGEVEALKAGTATITATLSWLVGGAEKTLTQSFSVSITEQGQPEVIPTDLILKDSKGQTLSADSLVELKVGDKFPVTAERKPEGAIGTVTFESDKPSVAAVGQTTGEVTAVSAGTAQITARLVWSTAGQSETGQMESRFKVKVTSSGPEPTPGAEDVEMLPGEVKRLNLFENHYTYPARWTLESADPKGCVTLKNGVVTAKPLKKGTMKAEAVVKAAYNGAIFTYNIKIDCDVPAAKAIPNGKKKIELKAPKKLNLNVGDAKKKSVTVKIPAELREGVSEDSIGCEMTVDDVCEIGKPVFDAKKTKATFEVDPVDAGATYIIWSMTRGEEETVAVTEVIVKKPRQENDFSLEQTMDLSVGEMGMIHVEDTANNTDPKDLSFSVKGKGIKVSKSGAVAAVVPGSSGTVTVKAGKIKREVRVTVSGDHASDYLMLNKALLSVKPGTKGKTVSLTLKRVVTPKKKVELPGISEIQVQGDISDQGIKGEADKSKPGKINVTVPAGTVPGTYLIVVEPEDTELNPVCCELIVK